MVTTAAERQIALDFWTAQLDDTTTLLAHPGSHHKLLVRHAFELCKAQTVSSKDLSDMLELADGALAYAIEAQLDLVDSDGADQ
ncbi:MULTISPECIES: hypothetical protein [Pseudomonas syringae group]|uniref:Uncharacterized protein n=1 Tax=Pseudomonas syringae group genomosp. 3 TaxID=251701 RepID=A0ABD6V854_9PSED|nr:MULTISPECIES: hypothetical protein [Pseudomonas syringae group]POD67197.1 hypothetical protein BKM07_17935 [Pseudomonas syringae group genomosp. 3]